MRESQVSVSAALLLAYLAFLRRQAVVDARRRRVRRQRGAWIAAEQAAVRREHARRAAMRAAERQELLRRSQGLAAPDEVTRASSGTARASRGSAERIFIAEPYPPG